MNALTFNGFTLTTINQDDQIWLTSSDLATALGYKHIKSLNKIYNSNADEFTDNMTRVIESTDSVVSAKTKGLRAKIRIFSLRGCHLLAMFARTKIAKDFRKWVLDILDRETKTNSIQRTPLRKACDRLAVGNMLISDAYKVVTSHYDVEHIDQIPESKLPEAVAFVYEAILVRQKPSSTVNDEAFKTNSHALCVHMVYCKEWFDSVRAPLKALNPEVTRCIAGQFDEGFVVAKLINRALGDM